VRLIAETVGSIPCKLYRDADGSKEPAKDVGADEVGKVSFELAVSVVVIALGGGVLDRAVHPLDMAVRLRKFRLGGGVPSASETRLAVRSSLAVTSL